MSRDEQKSLTELTLELMALSMQVSQTGIAHAFCDYSGHVNATCFYARPPDTDYQVEENRTFLYPMTTFSHDRPEIAHAGLACALEWCRAALLQQPHVDAGNAHAMRAPQ